MLAALAVLSTVVNVVNVKAATKLEIRLAEDQPAATLVEASVAHSDRKVYLHQEVVISNEDLIDARVMVNASVIAAPKLRDAIRASALITGDYTKEQADEIAAGLTGR
jgi:hypothetical protein